MLLPRGLMWSSQQVYSPASLFDDPVSPSATVLCLAFLSFTSHSMPSIRSLLSFTLSFPLLALAGNYSLSDNYQGNDFITQFDFFTDEASS